MFACDSVGLFSCLLSNYFFNVDMLLVTVSVYFHVLLSNYYFNIDMLLVTVSVYFHVLL